VAFLSSPSQLFKPTYQQFQLTYQRFQSTYQQFQSTYQQFQFTYDQFQSPYQGRRGTVTSHRIAWLFFFAPHFTSFAPPTIFTVDQPFGGKK
jgi:hypothetical protein